MTARRWRNRACRKGQGNAGRGMGINPDGDTGTSVPRHAAVTHHLSEWKTAARERRADELQRPRREHGHRPRAWGTGFSIVRDRLTVRFLNGLFGTCRARVKRVLQ